MQVPTMYLILYPHSKFYFANFIIIFIINLKFAGFYSDSNMLFNFDCISKLDGIFSLNILNIYAKVRDLHCNVILNLNY